MLDGEKNDVIASHQIQNKEVIDDYYVHNNVNYTMRSSPDVVSESGVKVLPTATEATVAPRHALGGVRKSGDRVYARDTCLLLSFAVRYVNESPLSRTGPWGLTV